MAGIRTPNPINEATKTEHNEELKSLEKEMPKVYKELHTIQRKLETQSHGSTLSRVRSTQHDRQAAEETGYASALPRVTPAEWANLSPKP